MIHVQQTRKYEGPAYRGNCVTACVASLFELPIDALPDFHGGGDSAVQRWLSVHYPGVTVRSRDFQPVVATREALLNAGVSLTGFWIATVESPRYKEECRYHVAEGGEPLPPFWYHREECPHCGGTGERPGFHALVAHGDEVAHDPHPDATGYDWEYNGRVCGRTWFEITDPSRLTPRLLPR